MRFHKLPYAVALLIMIYPSRIVAQQDQQESPAVSGKGDEPTSTESIERTIKSAEQGDVFAQQELGWMYANGNGVTQDYIQAYMWLTLSVEGTVNVRSNPYYQKAADLRDSIVQKMTPQQIEETRRLAKEWESRYVQEYLQRTADGPFVPGGNWGLSPPVALAQPMPSYTEQARRSRISGIVQVQCIIRKDGTLDSCRIVKGLGYGLDESVINTITTKWRFKPGTIQGKPLDTKTVIEVSFRIP